METSIALKTRRSIRKYKKDEVPIEIANEILGLAMMAPSAGNAQPWEFIVIRDKEVLKEIAEIHSHARMAKDAPMAILVLGNTSKEVYPGFWPEDCSAALENLLLAAHDKGLGAVWCGIHPNRDRELVFIQLFKLPENIIPFALVPMGYPAQAVGTATENRFDQNKVHYDKW
jgi:nitroreductase